MTATRRRLRAALCTLCTATRRSRPRSSPATGAEPALQPDFLSQPGSLSRSAEVGGAIAVRSQGSVSATDSWFRGNAASTGGGALSFELSLPSSLVGGGLIGNTAATTGGAVLASGAVAVSLQVTQQASSQPLRLLQFARPAPLRTLRSSRAWPQLAVASIGRRCPLPSTTSASSTTTPRKVRPSFQTKRC